VDVAEVVEMMAVGVELGVYHQVAEEQNWHFDLLLHA
jgi:hypothetical protein